MIHLDADVLLLVLSLVDPDDLPPLLEVSRELAEATKRFALSLVDLDAPRILEAGETRSKMLGLALRGRTLPSLKGLVVDSMSRGFVTGLATARMPSLKMANFVDCGMGVRETRAVVLALSRAAPGLSRIDLSSNRVRISHVAKALQGWDLKVLRLSHVGLDTAGTCKLAACFKKLPNLTHLDLSRNGLLNEGVSCLAMRFSMREASSLASLFLSATEFDDAGLISLCISMLGGGLPHLRELDLSGNSIGDRGMEAIRAVLERRMLPHLTHLNLSDNFVGDVGLSALVEGMMVGGGSIQVLDVEGNEFGEEGVESLARGGRRGLLPEARTLRLLDYHPEEECLHSILSCLEEGGFPRLERLSVVGGELLEEVLERRRASESGSRT